MRRSPSRPFRARPLLEILEDRLAPAAGALDPTFSGDGRLAVDIGPFWGAATSLGMVLQPDGKVVSVGAAAGGDFLVMRLNTNGALDPSFSNGSTDLTTWDGGDGMTTIDPNGLGGNSLTAVNLQADGKIVAAGGKYVVRLTADGRRDISFGTNGLVTLPLTSFMGTGIVVQPDGKIVVCGSANMGTATTGFDFVAMRLNGDGTLDASFDSDGVATIAIGAANAEDRANGITLQADGSIVLAGYAKSTTTSEDFAAVRLQSSGALDTGFGVGGKVVLPIRAGTNHDIATAVAVQFDGKIVLGGHATNGIFLSYDFTAVRLNSDGTLDTSFSADGIEIVPVGVASDEVTSLALQADGKIVLGGFSRDPYKFAAVRLNTDGTLDSSFDGDGKKAFVVGMASQNNLANGVAMTAGGAIVLVGYCWGDDPRLGSRVGAARLLADGSLDPSFDGGGIDFDPIVHTDGVVLRGWPTLSLDVGYAAALQPDGKILVSGSSTPYPVFGIDFSVARLNSDGSWDHSFGTNGFVYSTTGNYEGPTEADAVKAIALQPDGKIIIAGYQASGGPGGALFIGRLNANGSYDPTFQGTGYTYINLTTGDDAATALAVLADGKILVGGRTYISGNSDCVLLRLNADGSLDTTFAGGDGILSYSFGFFDSVNAMSVQSDGKILLAGQGATAYVARVNADGTFDMAFDGDGIREVGALGGMSSPYFEDFAVQSDGKIVAVGLASSASSQQFRIVRLNTDGTLDTSFDGDGFTAVAPNTSLCAARAVAVQFDGRIVVTGDTSVDFAAIRLLSDGTLDTSFDGDGKAVYDLSHTAYGYADNNSDDSVNSMFIQPDGNILVAGTSRKTPVPGTASGDFSLIRIDGGGVPPIDIQLSSGTIAENAGTNALIGTFTAIDPNALDTHTYTLVAGAGDADNGQFTITGSELRANGSFDFETKSSYTIRVRSTDQTGYTFEESFLITVTDVNEAPILAPIGNKSVEEASALTFTALASDPDLPANTLTFSLVNAPAGATINSTTGAFTWTPTDGGTYTVTVRVSDNGTPSLYDEETITITVANLVDLSGRVFDDRDNDGVFEPGDGDTGLGGVPVQVWNQTLTTLFAQGATAGDGTYFLNANLLPGNYKLVEVLDESVNGLLDGKESAGGLGGVVENTQDSNAIGVTVAAGDADAGGYNFAEILPSRLQALVWEDFDNDGQIDLGEKAIASVALTLTGSDDRGAAVSRTMTTDTQGIVEFLNLRPGNYTLTETQPGSYVDGLDSVGTVNGVVVGSTAVNDQVSQILLANPGSDAVNYNFGERLPAGGEVQPGQSATIGFWQNKNGQNLIKSLNGGSSATQLGSWLAATFPNMYGASAGASNLAGKTNAEIAALYTSLFKRTGQTAPGGPPKLDAQVLAVAFAAYVTNQTLAGTTAAAYGFNVTAQGIGASTFNVGSNGAAFGVANYSTLTILDLLLATNARTTNGLLYDLDDSGTLSSTETSLREMANSVFTAINETGDI